MCNSAVRTPSDLAENTNGKDFGTKRFVRENDRRVQTA